MNRVLFGTTNGNELKPIGTQRTALALPLLVFCDAAGNARFLRELQSDARVELVVTRHLTPAWVSFSRRVAAGTMLLATHDPFATLAYARTAGLCGHVMLMMDQSHARRLAELETVGDVSCLPLPLDASSREEVVRLLQGGHSAAGIEFNSGLLLDPIRRVVEYRGATLRLSPREFALLHCLSQNWGRPVQRSVIFHYIWDNSTAIQSPQIVDVHVSQLRRKLRGIGLPNAIRTARGYGYALDGNEVYRSV